MIKVDFEKGNGLIPCIVQDVHTLQVLMLAYMNEESLQETLRSGLATYWSTQPKRIMEKRGNQRSFSACQRNFD